MEFKINQIVFDRENKELVKISNGTNDFDKGPLVPTEAVAIRFIGMDEGKPVLAFTYRKVNPIHLSATSQDMPSFDEFLNSEIKTRKPNKKSKSQHFVYIGRV